MKNQKLKIGQKFERNYTTPFGKECSEIITIVALTKTSVLFDNGLTLHPLNLSK